MNDASQSERRLRRDLLKQAFGMGLAVAGVSAAAETNGGAIQLVVPFVPGGMTDLLGRLVAQRLTEQQGRTVVVENRAGAGGHIGAQRVAKAPADGTTLLLGTIGIHAAYASYRKLSYDPAAELLPVTILAESPNVVVVPADSPFRDFGAFLQRARSDARGLDYATAGPGSSTHMVVALFETMSGAKVNYVPYKGSGPAMIDLIGGRVDVMFENLPTALPHLRGGKVRALAVTGPTRDPRIPDVPTIAEAGLPGYSALSWFTVAVPAATPAPSVEQLVADLRQALSTPAVQRSLDDMAATLVLADPGRTRAFVAEETAKWNRVIEATRLQID